MPTVRSYGLPEQEARAIPAAYPQTPAAGDLATFGGNQARDLQQAGENLGRTADITFSIYERAAKEANELKVDSEMNKFVVEKQKLLVDFSQLKGEDAIKGASAVADSLVNAKKGLMAGAANDYQRNVLSRRLDAHLLDATGSVTSHVAKEAQAARVQTGLSTLNNLNNQGVIDQDNEKAIDTQLGIVRDIATNIAKTAHGQSASPEIIKDITDKAQSEYISGILRSKIANNSPDTVAFHDKHKDKLTAKDRPALEQAVETLKSSQKAQDFVRGPVSGPSGETAKAGVKTSMQHWTADGYSAPVAAGITAGFLRESQFNGGAVNKGDGRDGSDSISIGQWNGARAVAYKSFAAANGMDPRDPKTGLAYAKAEIDGVIPYSVTGLSPAFKAKLLAAKSEKEAADIMTREYFRPKDTEGESTIRQDSASTILAQHTAAAPAPDSRVGDPLAAQVNATTAGRTPPTLESSVNAATAPQAQQVIDAAQGVPNVRQNLIKLGDWRQKKLEENQAKYGNDPEQFKKNQAAINTSFEQQKQAIELQKNQLWDAIWASIKANPTKMPSDLLTSQLDPREVESLQKMVDRNIEGKKTKTDWNTYTELRQALLDPNPDVSGPASKLNPMQFRPVMADDEFKEITKLQEAIRTGDPNKHLTRVQTVTGMVNDTIRSVLDMKTAPPPGSDAAEKVALFHRAVDVQVGEFERQKGKKATNEEIQKIIDGLVIKVGGTDGWLGVGRYKRAYEVKITDVPKADQDAIRGLLTKNGQPVTDQAVIDIYARQNSKGR